MDEAAKLFQEMKASTSGYCDIVAYNTLIKGHCTERRVDRALELFHELRERGLTANDVSYNSILNSYIRDRCYREAWDWYELMRKDGMKEDSYTISPLATVNTIMKAFSSLKRIDEAMELW